MEEQELILEKISTLLTLFVATVSDPNTTLGIAIMPAFTSENRSIIENKIMKLLQSL